MKGALRLSRRPPRTFVDDVTEQEAIELYNRAGLLRGKESQGVRWPDLDLESSNLERTAEEIFGARSNLAGIALGEDFDSEAGESEVDERWRTDRLEVRFAPEGVMVRASFTVRFVVAGAAAGEPTSAEEVLIITGEFCLSHTELHGVCPVVDFLQGEVCRVSEQTRTNLNPFTMRLDAVTAVMWGLNGVEKLP